MNRSEIQNISRSPDLSEVVPEIRTHHCVRDLASLETLLARVVDDITEIKTRERNAVERARLAEMRRRSHPTYLRALEYVNSLQPR